MEEKSQGPSASPPLPPENPPPFIAKTVQDLKRGASEANLFSKIDLPTLTAVAAVISQHGFNHFEASKDTRIASEARKAHRFVAINCEDLARKTLRLSGKSYEECEKMLCEVARAAIDFKEQRRQERGGKPA